MILGQLLAKNGFLVTINDETKGKYHDSGNSYIDEFLEYSPIYTSCIKNFPTLKYLEEESLQIYTLN